jgi:hypothetical protein
MTENTGLDIDDLFYQACDDGDFNRATQLIAQGADIERQLGDFTPLEVAEYNWHHKIVKLIKDTLKSREESRKTSHNTSL